MVALRGPKLEGAMAPEIDLSQQRPADYVFSRHVQEKLTELKHRPPAKPQVADAAD